MQRAARRQWRDDGAAAPAMGRRARWGTRKNLHGADRCDAAHARVQPVHHASHPLQRHIHASGDLHEAVRQPGANQSQMVAEARCKL